MGGCGKTQVALEYCRQGQNEKWFSAIFWFDASTLASMAQSFSNVADELSKPNFDAADVKGNIRFVPNEEYLLNPRPGSMDQGPDTEAVSAKPGGF
ncbi:hypothetical protein GMDG_04355 [Pseudogymnoascus destructans 20631-21]|uniref:NB-ARC domain-containing protein n=1 Tax=Pseudogymnoascus destructans (strain ATCC MYA-4855 / 20631-21) TaxID=658429 RepID=L8G9G2_PSED2|nr:hypothetical protein GMDG_04355 [Pseudogymnoascus destructans 20631-21]